MEASADTGVEIFLARGPHLDHVFRPEHGCEKEIRR